MLPKRITFGCCASGFFIFAALYTYFRLSEKRIELMNYQANSETLPSSTLFLADRFSISRLEKYCNRQNISADNIARAASNGSFPYGQQFSMINMVWVIRHGDRSAIHAFTNLLPPTSPPQGMVDPSANSKIVENLSHFKLHFLSDGKAKAGHDGEDLSQSLDPSTQFKATDFNLGQGQLTSRGFMQHVRLGKALQATYQDYLQSIVDVDQLRIRSTNYARTIQSVAGLVIGSFPTLLGKSKIEIATYPNEVDEVMHGVGLRSSSHGVSSAGQSSTEIQGSCPVAISTATKEKDAFKTNPKVVEELEELFGAAAGDMSPPEFVDAAMASYCHAQPLPCTTNGQCLQRTQLQRMMEEADRYYCARYSGTKGGFDSTRLATFPLAHEIMTTLLDIPPTLVRTASSKNMRRNVTILSGHDTVIAPLVAVLDAFPVKQPLSPFHCEWPGYASNIIFELHTFNLLDKQDLEVEKEREKVIKQAKSILKNNDYLRAVYPTNPRSTTDILSDNLFVRVVFNGRDITQQMHMCRQERLIVARSCFNSHNTKNSSSISLSSVSRLLDDEFPLCTAGTFRQQIEHLIHPVGNLTEACRVSGKKKLRRG